MSSLVSFFFCFLYFSLSSRQTCSILRFLNFISTETIPRTFKHRYLAVFFFSTNLSQPYSDSMYTVDKQLFASDCQRIVFKAGDAIFSFLSFSPFLHYFKSNFVWIFLSSCFKSFMHIFFSLFFIWTFLFSSFFLPQINRKQKSVPLESVPQPACHNPQSTRQLSTKTKSIVPSNPGNQHRRLLIILLLIPFKKFLTLYRGNLILSLDCESSQGIKLVLIFCHN